MAGGCPGQVRTRERVQQVDKIYLQNSKGNGMIDAKELRIGNWVTVDSAYEGLIKMPHQQITGLREGLFWSTHIAGGDLGWIEPILLTPEWLERAGLLKGFRLAQHFYWVAHLTLYRKQMTGNAIHQFIANIEFVHELQNLWHALTGEELIFEP